MIDVIWMQQLIFFISVDIEGNDNNDNVDDGADDSGAAAADDNDDDNYIHM